MSIRGHFKPSLTMKMNVTEGRKNKEEKEEEGKGRERRVKEDERTLKTIEIVVDGKKKGFFVQLTVKTNV